METVLVFLMIGLSIPTGLLCYWLTRDEKYIYDKYFGAFFWVLAILTAVFLSINLTYAITTLFMILVLVTWLNGGKIINPKP